MQTSYTDHESRPAVTVDGALYCEPATARRPLGRSSGRRKASRNGDTYHDIDPVGIFMQLTTALACPNGAKILLLFMAPRQWEGAGNVRGFSTVRCEYE